MAKKTPSAAVVKAVQTSLPVVAPTPEPKVRGEKKFTTEQYLKEYMVEHASGGTWASLCERTGFVLNNVRQAITTLRSEYRAAMKEKAAGSPDFLKMLEKAKTDIDVWADKKAEEKFPFLQEGARNTQKAKLRQAWQNEELSL